MNKDLPIYSIDIDELDETTGIDLISVVDRPAIQSNFIKLEEDMQSLQLASDRQKQYVTGAVLVPDKLIYRRDPKGEEYYIKFSAESIEKIRNKFFLKGQLKLSNLDHSADDLIEGYLIESWLVEHPEKDKSAALGLNLPKGSLVATYHFPDAKTWEAVSERNGFSLEGNFLTKKESLEEVQEPIHEDTLESVLDLLIEMLGGADA